MLKCPPKHFVGLLSAVAIFAPLCASGAEQPVAEGPRATATIVVLGDSITKGVRAGVSDEQTFAAVVERRLKADGLAVKVVNLGIGGERTDQALLRLDQVYEQKPRVVTVMYGTNDSYVDQGQTESRITREAYRANLKQIVAELRRRGIEPILMTEPRWAIGAKNGLGEDPNVRLAPFMEACREAAQECNAPLVDHFAQWTEDETKGQKLADWTTDLCHPNPTGHEAIAAAMLPAVQRSLEPPAAPKTAARLAAGETTKIVCFGDSVTGVYYHTGGRRAYTDMLGIALGRAFPAAKDNISMINAGISGHNTAHALARIDRDVLAHQPALVTVMFGLNDMNAVPLEQYKANLDSIIDKCRAAGAEVLLCTPNNVIDTAGRPTERLVKYCDALREVGKAKQAPVCDCYAELEAFRGRDAGAWRLLMSDEIHPNMDGHKRIAEIMARSIAGRSASLADVPPPEQPLAKTRARTKSGEAVKALVIAPCDSLLAAAFKQVLPEAKLEITPWDVQGKSLAEIEADAQARVRAMRPDLVVVAVPRIAQFDGGEAFIRGYSWIMNWSLSFGLQEWDCVVVHPSVVDPAGADAVQDALIRRLVAAQDLTLVDRPVGDERTAEEILVEWLKKQ